MEKFILEPSHNNDAELIHAAQGGDNEAFALLFERYSQGIMNYLVRHGVPVSIIEDFRQETFLRAFIHIRDYREGFKFFNWLCTIAYHAYLDSIRRDRRVSYNDVIGVVTPDSSRESYPEDLAIVDDEFGRVMTALHRLTSIEAAAIYCRYYLGLSLQETAEKLGRSESAIKSATHRGMRALQKLLNP